MIGFFSYAALSVRALLSNCPVPEWALTSLTTANVLTAKCCLGGDFTGSVGPQKDTGLDILHQAAWVPAQIEVAPLTLQQSWSHGRSTRPIQTLTS
jgi:hypothetical protein